MVSSWFLVPSLKATQFLFNGVVVAGTASQRIAARSDCAAALLLPAQP
jgi:hypothetical protein